MRTIKKIHNGRYAPIADLKTYSPIPSPSLKQIDPFIFLNHHGPQFYLPNNQGLPFGPHPHRGMETVTFIIDGSIMHKDTGGHESIITAGGVQWMTAGRGLIHAEVSPDAFKQDGGDLEILQLWLNLPSRYKMNTPYYKGLQKEEIPTIAIDNGNATLSLISGDFEGHKGVIASLGGVMMSIVRVKAGSSFKLLAPIVHNIFFYVVKGQFQVNRQQVKAFQLIEFINDSENIEVECITEGIFLYGHAAPLNEPMVAHGPFVMNSEEEIHQAYEDYRRGAFGMWEN